MDIKITWNNGEKQIEVYPSESEFYKAIGEVIYSLKNEIPNDVMVESPIGSCEYKLNKRGTYVENNVTYPSMYVTEVYNNIYGLEDSEYSDAYLTCIHPESNNCQLPHPTSNVNLPLLDGACDKQVSLKRGVFKQLKVA